MNSKVVWLIGSIGVMVCLAGCSASAEQDEDPSPTAVPNSAPKTTIQSPAGNSRYKAGASICFEGSSTDKEDGTIAGDKLTWVSSIDGTIGTGSKVCTSDLSDGDHHVTLLATDSDGANGSAQVTVTVYESAKVYATDDLVCCTNSVCAATHLAVKLDGKTVYSGIDAVEIDLGTYDYTAELDGGNCGTFKFNGKAAVSKAGGCYEFEVTGDLEVQHLSFGTGTDCKKF